MAMRRKLKHKRLIYVLCLVDLIILIAAFGFVFHDYIGQLLAFLDPDVDRQLLKTVFRDHGIEDAFFLLLLTITTTAIPVFSSSVVCIFNGACFGPCIGFLMNLCGTSLGNLCMWLFFYALRSAKTFSKDRRVHCGNRTAQAKNLWHSRRIHDADVSFVYRQLCERSSETFCFNRNFMYRNRDGSDVFHLCFWRKRNL